MLIQMNVGKLEGESEPAILINPATGTMLKYWPGKIKDGGTYLAVYFTLPGCKDMEIFHSKEDLMDFINAWVEANGGIYFSDKKDILSFLNYGSYIAQCTPVGDIYENPGYPKKWKAHSVKLGQFRPLNKKSTWDWIKKQGIVIGTQSLNFIKNTYPDVGV